MQGICRQQIIMTQKLNFLIGRVENRVRKGENAGYQHFPLFQQCFEKLLGLFKKSQDSVVKS